MPLTKLNATQGLTGTLPAVSGANLTNIDGGKVLQVVNSNMAYERVSSDNSGFVDVQSSSGTSWVTSITPSATSSKIFIIAMLGSNNYQSGSSEGDQRGVIKMLGDINGAGYNDLTHQHKTGGYSYGGSSYGVSIGQATTFSYIWSPSTTSQCNVKFQFQPVASNGYMGVHGTGSQVNTCQLLEVGS